MKKFIAGLFILAALIFVTALIKPKETKESLMLKAMAENCMMPVFKTEDIAQFAEKQKLPELSKEEALAFNKDGARVFAIPAVLGDAVLIASLRPGVCEIAIREADPKEFWRVVELYFGSMTPYQKTIETTNAEKVTEKHYLTVSPVNVMALISLGDHPAANGLQGVMTFGRISIPSRSTEANPSISYGKVHAPVKRALDTNKGERVVPRVKTHKGEHTKERE